PGSEAAALSDSLKVSVGKSVAFVGITGTVLRSSGNGLELPWGFGWGFACCGAGNGFFAFPAALLCPAASVPLPAPDCAQSPGATTRPHASANAIPSSRFIPLCLPHPLEC